MKFVKLFFLTAAALITLGFVQACSDDANAEQAEVTQAEFDALVARVEALEVNNGGFNSKPRDTLYSPATAPAASKGQFKTAAADWVDIGTRLECLPTNDFFGEWCRILSPNGYYFGLPLGLGDTYPLQAGRIYYEQAGCTGTPHMYFNDVAPDADVQGFVTGVKPAGNSTPTAIYMFRAGTAVKTNITMQSYIDAPFTPCVDSAQGPMSFFELEVNDPAVSGVSNENYGQLSLLP